MRTPTKTFYPACAFFCLAILSLAFGDEPDKPKPVNLNELQLDLTPLNDWKTQRFTYLARNDKNELTPAGSITMRTEVDDQHIQLDDSGNFAIDQSQLALSLQVTSAKDAALTPKKIAIQQDLMNYTRAATATVHPDHVTGEIHTGNDPVPIHQALAKGSTTTDFGLFRVATLLPREPNRVYQIDNIVRMSVDLEVQQHATIRCLGPETIEWQSEKIPCTRYHIDRGGGYGFHIWVDGDRRLQRIFIIHLDRQMELLRPKAKPDVS